MKKIIFSSIVLLAVSAVATLNVITNTKISKLSDIALANVEALAAERDPDNTGCWVSDLIDCSEIVITPTGNYTQKVKGKDAS